MPIPDLVGHGHLINATSKPTVGPRFARIRRLTYVLRTSLYDYWLIASVYTTATLSTARPSLTDNESVARTRVEFIKEHVMSDCQTFHYDAGRLGQGEGAAVGSQWHKKIAVALGSAVRGAPLYLQGWVIQEGAHAGETHNMIYVATSDNHVNAYAEDDLLVGNTAPRWSVLLGAPVTRTGSNIPPPLGICSTPVLDPANARLFVCAYQDDSGNSVYHMYALDLDTGTTLQQAPLSDPGAAGRPTFDGSAQDQRGGLNLVNGRVYATFADFYAYDQGTYYGWVASCNANNLYNQWFFPVAKNVLGGGCWGPGGAAAAPDGSLYIATGNATTADDAYWNSLPSGQHPGDIGDYFIAVVRLGVAWTGYSGHLSVLDWYQPTNSKTLNDNDLDLGSSSCLILPDIGGMQLLVLAAKDSIYLLNRNNLGHWGGELDRKYVFAGESHSAPAYFRTPAGDHYVYFTGAGQPGLICYKVAVSGGTASLQEIWRAGGTGMDFDEACSSPTVGAVSSPSDYALVWVADAGTTPVLRAFNALDGSLVYHSDSTAADDLDGVPHYPPVTCAGDSVLVGNTSGFSMYRANHKWWKDLKPEIKEVKELKEFKFEHKEIMKPEFDQKQIFEGNPKEIVEAGPGPRFGGDPVEFMKQVAQRLDQITEQLVTGKAFIRPEQRPPVGDQVLRDEFGKDKKKP